MNVFEGDHCCDGHGHCDCDETPVVEDPEPTTYTVDLEGDCATECEVPLVCPAITGMTLADVFKIFDPTFDFN